MEKDGSPCSNSKTILRNTDGAVKQRLSIFDANVSASIECRGWLRMGNIRSMVYKKHLKISHKVVSKFFLKYLYDCCLFVA